MKAFMFIALTLAVVASTAVALKNESIPYPDGYRHWTHVKSMVLLPGHALENPFEGIHHVYANDKAAAGLTSGKYADGSVFVFDLLAYSEADKAGTEGARKLLGIMHKDGKRFAATGGWGFEGFKGDSKTERLVTDNGQSCFSCHASQKERDYVFSAMRK